MGRFIEGCDRREQLFLPPCVDDYVAEDSAVRIVDVFVDELDLATLGFPFALRLRHGNARSYLERPFGALATI